jgi:hypothetical protein
MNFKGN